MKESQAKQKSEKLDLDQYLLLPIFFILLILATVESRAQSTAIQSNAIQVSEVAAPAEVTKKKLEVNLSLQHSSNLMKNSNPDKDDSTSLILKSAYSFSEKTNLNTRVDLVQAHDSERRTKTSNTLLAFQPTSIDLSKELAFKPILVAVLPTDETQRHAESYQGTISLRPTLNYMPSKIPGLTLSNGIFLNKMFHEYEFKRDFSANNEYSIRNRFIIAYEINGKWALELANDYVRSWTYNGYQNDAFYFIQELSHQFIKDWTVYVSHKNEGSARGPNNNGDNVEILNEKSSYVSLGLTHVF